MNSQKSLIRRFLPLIIVLAVLIAVAAVATPTIAYYLRKANDVEGDDYTPAGTNVPSFQLSADNKTMSNVYVTVGDEGYPVYVRAVIVVTWQDAHNGDISVLSPEPNTDYEWSLGKEWANIDGFYYYTKAVESGGNTSVLIESFEYKSTQPAPDANEEPCVLNVEIIVQTVQAKGTTDVGDTPAWQDAWGISSAPWTDQNITK